MRILDNDTSKSLENIILYLTAQEALELRDSIQDLLIQPKNNHAHIPSEDFKKEITICIYSPNDPSGFNERSTNLIIEDK